MGRVCNDAREVGNGFGREEGAPRPPLRAWTQRHARPTEEWSLREANIEASKNNDARYSLDAVWRTGGPASAVCRR